MRVMTYISGHGRTASFHDLLPSCVVRVAASLDLIDEVVAFTASCIHARECLGVKGVAGLPQWKGNEVWPPQPLLTVDKYAVSYTIRKGKLP